MGLCFATCHDLRLMSCGALGKLLLEVAGLPKELGGFCLMFLKGKSVRTQVQRLSALP